MTSREQMVEKAAQAIANVENGGNVEHSYRDVAAVVLDVILPQVSTVAEIEALPFGTSVVDADGNFWQRGDDFHFHWQGLDSSWHSEDLATNFAPLTVVWQPEVTA